MVKSAVRNTGQFGREEQLKAFDDATAKLHKSKTEDLEDEKEEKPVMPLSYKSPAPKKPVPAKPAAKPHRLSLLGPKTVFPKTSSSPNPHGPPKLAKQTVEVSKAPLHKAPRKGS